MSDLLFNEPPLVIRPKVAHTIGLNGAIVLQQINYWLQRSKNRHNSRVWVYKTYEEWHEEFPFWSVATIKRTLYSLREKGIVLVDRFNKKAYDKTNWYTIDYDELDRLVKMTHGSDESDGSECTVPSDQNDPTNTRDYTETTKEPPSGEIKEDILDAAGLHGVLAEQRKSAASPSSSVDPAHVKERIQAAYNESLTRERVDIPESLAKQYCVLAKISRRPGQKEWEQWKRVYRRVLQAVRCRSLEHALYAQKMLFVHDDYRWYHYSSPLVKRFYDDFLDALRRKDLASRPTSRVKPVSTTHLFTGEVTHHE